MELNPTKASWKSQLYNIYIYIYIYSGDQIKLF